MVKTGYLLEKESPRKSPEQKIREIGDALNITRKTPRKTREKKEKKEELTELERELLAKILTAYLKQYPLKTKNPKNPDRYAHNHKMAAILEKKLLRMKLIPKEEKGDENK